jgi:hypothetical protein
MLKTCPTCRRTGTFRPWHGTITLRGFEIPTSGIKCRACGEEIYTGDEVARGERLLAAAIVARGIRDGSDFKWVRKIAGYSAVEIAAMFDVRPETVSRWERGEVEVPRIAAYALGELFSRPRVTRQKLEALARTE